MAIVYKGTAGNNRIRAESVFPYDEVIQMHGYTGDDELIGAFLNPNEIFGGSGNDTLQGGSDTNLLDGGDGNDVLDTWQGDYSILRGGAGNDFLKGGNRGGFLDGGAGFDTMTGGDGGDIYVVNHLRDEIIETYEPYYDNDPNPVDQVNAWVSWTLGGNLENLVLQGRGAINGTGNHFSNVIVGNAGNNSLSGGQGADTIEGGLGNDIIDGGLGIDTARFTGGTAVSVNLSKVVAQNTGVGLDTIRNIENFVTGAGNDRIIGSAGANSLTAGSGNDVLSGLAGNDRLFGQAGNDRLQGGSGNDILTGGFGADGFLFSRGDGNDKITDFANGIDRIVINSGAETFGQVRIADLGADARVSFGNVTIILSNFDHTRLGIEDFIFT
ncbi:Bifunctional hemolysin/adenylate cyclase (plasmid) [Paracoccus marcusii]|uniref:calcium-binding protein n=1 Tax=Paracoccus marcusii TaxID=59779 RepID=UPI001C3D8F6D|nr:calcium-binding protein [Paracoccus marcusii]QXI66114.1 Bifunctional hemolysin/adenylate cyclase [Paracoccus marcusii]